MYTEQYHSGTFTQTEAERARDRARRLQLAEEVRRAGMGECCLTEAKEWNEVWRIPLDKATMDLREADFQRLRALGVTLSIKESFEGTSYWLEMPKFRSRWRGWTRVQMGLYVTSILGILYFLTRLTSHVQSIH